MKNLIGIIGDCHLGASVKAGSKDPVTGISSRLQDYFNTLIFAIDNLKEKGCETIVFTGDIFEHRYPQMIQQQLFSSALRHALDLGVKKIVIVEGNHDQQRTSNTSTLAYLDELKLDNIVVANDMKTIDIDGHKLHLFPYRDRRYYGASSYSEALKYAEADVQLLAAKNGNKVNLLVGHMALEGTFFTEEESELYTDNELMLLKTYFNPFNLTIMGHVHTPAKISATPPIYYVGSLEKRGAFESHKKSAIIVDLDSKDIQWVELPCRDFYEYNVVLPKSGVDFSKNLYENLDFQIANSHLAGAIVKVSVRIKSDDIGRYDADQIRNYFASKNISFCIPPSMYVESDRTSRSDIKEQVSDTDTWSQYIKQTGLQSDIADRMIEIGNSIIAEKGSE